MASIKEMAVEIGDLIQLLEDAKAAAFLERVEEVGKLLNIAAKDLKRMQSSLKK